MNTRVEVLEHELAHLNATIAAAESWADSYAKDPKTHAKLIAVEGKLERSLRDYLRDLANRAPAKYINWMAYNQELANKKASSVRAADYDITVIFQSNMWDEQEPYIFQGAVHDPIVQGVTVGAQAGEAIYNKPLGMTSSFDSIINAARQQSASLVGKKVKKDGTVVNNPNAKMNVTDTTRSLIQKSIATSLQLNETQEQAVTRLQSSSGIKDYQRATNIARTESVRSYSNGITAFGVESGATGKEWDVSGDPCDICAPLDGAQAPIDEDFDGGYDAPPAHPSCRCGIRLMYANEYAGDGSTADAAEADDLEDN